MSAHPNGSGGIQGESVEADSALQRENADPTGLSGMVEADF
jgi:hypothetical protein